MTVRSAWHLNPGQTRQDSRLAPLETPTPVDSMTGRSGLLPGGNPCLLTGSGMAGSISTGRAIVQGTTTQGAYPVVVTAAEPITVANGHASLARVDSVFLVAYDQLYDTSGQTLAAVVYVQGTAASSPTAPTAPATGTAYMRLWDIAVPAGASAGSPINWGTALTDRRTYTAAVGGITPDGATAGSYAGQYRDGGSYLERYNGSAWESRVYLGAAGRVVIGGDTALYRGGANALKTDGSVQALGMASAYVETSSGQVTSSTSYAAVSPALSATAVVPPSGLLHVYGTVRQDINAGHYAFSSFNVVGSVSGTLRGPQDAFAILTGSGSYMQAGGSLAIRVTSVNPGETVTVTWQHKVDSSGGAANIYSRAIGITPLIG